MLSTLAIEALEDYVTSLLVKYLNVYEYDYAKAEAVCQNLKDMLIASVPPSLVNQVTYRLLRGFDNINYSDVACALQVVQKFVNAVLHPGVTELIFGPEFLHESLRGFDWNYVVVYVYRQLKHLQRLKRFRMSSDQYVKLDCITPVILPSSLEEFTLMYSCIDSVLEKLANLCQNLKHLNVSKSRNVSDRSVSSILKMKHLIELNVEGTDITEGGISQLLNGMIENKVSDDGYSWSCASQLLSFGCSNATTSHVHTLVTSFPNLVSVILSCDKNCSLLELKEMENINVLWLSYMQFPKIHNLLVSLGSQIHYLEICDVGPINVKAIGEACSSLKCLHIVSSDTSSIPTAEDFHSPLAGFQSVECVVLKLDFNPEMVEYILIQCQNLKRLEVTVQIGNDSAIVRSVLSKNSLKRLEEFNWWGSSGTLSRRTAIKVVQHCPQLQVMRGPFVWIRGGDLRELRRYAKRNLWLVEPKFLYF